MGCPAQVAIAPIGAAESSTRLAIKVCTKRRSDASAVDHHLARLHDRALEGWPPLAARAPPLTLLRSAVRSAAGTDCAPAPTWPSDLRDGSRCMMRYGAPWRPAELRADVAPCPRSRRDRTAAWPGFGGLGRDHRAARRSESNCPKDRGSRCLSARIG
jgi:hypothetical protein